MKRPLAILITLGIVCGMPVGTTLLVGLGLGPDATGVVGVLVGMVFGTFAPTIYQALRDSRKRVR